MQLEIRLDLTLALQEREQNDAAMTKVTAY
jgi:hypothetical protein